MTSVFEIYTVYLGLKPLKQTNISYFTDEKFEILKKLDPIKNLLIENLDILKKANPQMIYYCKDDEQNTNITDTNIKIKNIFTAIYMTLTMKKIETSVCYKINYILYTIIPDFLLNDILKVDEHTPMFDSLEKNFDNNEKLFIDNYKTKKIMFDINFFLTTVEK